MFSLLASKCSSKDTQEILTNFSRVLRLGFGGKLAKVFASQNKTDVQNESIKSSVHKDELDKLAMSYGGGKGVNMTEFPVFKFKDPKIDTIDLICDENFCRKW